MCIRCTKLDLSYRQRNVVNYMTTRLAIAFAAALALLCSACGQNTDAPSEASSAPAGPVLVISESTESSQQSSTIAGISPTTEMKGSGTAPGAGGTGSTAPNKSHEAGTTKPTSPVVPDKRRKRLRRMVPRVRQPLTRLLSAPPTSRKRPALHDPPPLLQRPRRRPRRNPPGPIRTIFRR